MKKTLAAVLAAMMALSTATVAMAKDSFETDATLSGSTGKNPTSTNIQLKIGADKSFDFATTTFENRSGSLSAFSAADLGALISDKAVKTTVKITDGRSNLAYLPTLTSKGGIATLKVKFAHNYDPIVFDNDDVDPVEASVKVDITAKENIYWNVAGAKYTTDAKTDDVENVKVLNKGDTIHVGEIDFESAYEETDDYGTDMTFTTTEVSANETVIFAETLIEELEGEALTLYFGENGDLAAWNGKISESQKDLNVYYSLDAIEAVEELAEELEIEPEYITFKGDVKFYKSGSLTFNAIGGEDTVVYEVVDGELQELVTEYDSTYDVVTVDGVKVLTSYVIASEALVAEVEEPVVEEPAVEEENPNTGAC